jgi:hypothetical protein
MVQLENDPCSNPAVGVYAAASVIPYLSSPGLHIGRLTPPTPKPSPTDGPRRTQVACPARRWEHGIRWSARRRTRSWTRWRRLWRCGGGLRAGCRDTRPAPVACEVNIHVVNALLEVFNLCAVSARVEMNFRSISCKGSPCICKDFHP